jgi:hypothetical protein
MSTHATWLLLLLTASATCASATSPDLYGLIRLRNDANCETLF